jgi:hypothetical protein
MAWRSRFEDRPMIFVKGDRCEACCRDHSPTDVEAFFPFLHGVARPNRIPKRPMPACSGRTSCHHQSCKLSLRSQLHRARLQWSFCLMASIKPVADYQMLNKHTTCIVPCEVPLIGFNCFWNGEKPEQKIETYRGNQLDQPR